MPISRKIRAAQEHASWIRRMFEEGRRLKALHGEAAVQDLSLGNPTLEPPEAFRERLRAVLADDRPGWHRYMPNSGFPQARAAVAAHFRQRTSLPVDERHCLMSVGAGGGLNVLFKSILDPGDEVIVLAPYFPEYDFYVDNHGGVAVHVPTDARFQPDLAALDRARTPRTRAIIINCPNNPTGVIYPQSAVEALARWVDQTGELSGRPCYLISDEPYRRIHFGPPPPEILPLSPYAIVVTSHSKDLAIPGERIGAIVLNPRHPEVDALFTACTFATRTLGFVNAPALMQRAVMALQDVGVAPEEYRRRRDIIVPGLKAAGYEMVEPDGAFYLFPRSPIPDDIAFVQALLRELVLVVPGSGFGRGGHFRVAYCVDEAVLRRALPGFQRARAAVRKSSRLPCMEVPLRGELGLCASAREAAQPPIGPAAGGLASGKPDRGTPSAEGARTEGR